MKMKSLVIATALAMMATGGAFAQSGNMNSMSGVSKDSKSVPAPSQQVHQKDQSPASTDSGAKQEK
jgi:hypothetical protein